MSETFNNILLIEDEKAHAELIQRAFEDEGARYRITHVASLGEAREKIPHENFNLIIADWRLPDGESMELLTAKRGKILTPIVLMTSYGSERVAVEALKSGALDYVVKSPESMMDMPHIAERAIQQWNTRAEKARMGAALSESEAQFRLLAENASDMISRMTTDGRFLYISPACQTILGYAPSELIGARCFKFIHADDLRAIKAAFQVQPQNKTYILSYQALKKDGTYIWLESSARPIFDEKTQTVIEIQTSSRDITERKQAEQDLREAHERLQDAYKKTIEGWVRALDLRDKETEGHTQRVTELTVRVAQRLGFAEESLAALRQGALLHDMGKIAIPDDILLKPGPLNEAEWEKMRQHPIYAYEMLLPILHLQDALEIPYAHHERWDGSGYPRGLRKTEIPLSARLFAIVDVWDALLSDRPYRKSLQRKEVEQYLRDKAGILFDPDLVARFLKIVKELSV